MLRQYRGVKLLLGYRKNPVPGHYQARVVFGLRPYELQALPATIYQLVYPRGRTTSASSSVGRRHRRSVANYKRLVVDDDGGPNYKHCLYLNYKHCLYQLVYFCHCLRYSSSTNRNPLICSKHMVYRNAFEARCQ